MWVRVFVAAILLLLPASAFAQAEKRVALLIGNQGYAAKVGPLKNPHNDVDLIKTSLERIGFKVTVLKDANYKAMDSALKRYVDEVRLAGPGALSFFYYSGHGVANSETQINYLIPIDVTDTDDNKVWYESFQQNAVIDLLSKQAPRATHYVVFDACRNELNITGASTKALGADKGFVPLNETSGLLIAYATAPKKTASDVGIGGGPYAKILAEELVKPGVESVMMFRNVQIRVKQTIGQDPWLSFPSLPPVYLAGKSEPSAPPPPPPIALPRLREAAEAWGAAKDSNSTDELEAFIARYKDTFFAELARERLGKLKADEFERLGFPKFDVAVPFQPRKEQRQPSEKRKIVDLSPRRGMRLLELPFGCGPGETSALVGDNERCLKPGDNFKDCPDCPEMVVVPAGSFTMGSPSNEPERNYDEVQIRVSIATPFAVGKYAVTFDEWDACVAGGGCNGHKPSDEGWGRAKRPVINVNWDDAKAYAAWLSHKTGKTYRLLSEAEREYVTRAGTTTPFWWGSSITLKQAQLNSIHGGYGLKAERRLLAAGPVPVDNFEPNPWGLYNVHGNVWDWTEDCWNETNAGNPGDGRARTTGDCSKRETRGGSWDNGPELLRSAVRRYWAAHARANFVGFRLARTLNP
jgi:formylglycine-generating enzyme required for sulfatase activity